MKKITITMNEWQKELSKLPDVVKGPGCIKYTKEQDEQIIWARKNKKNFTVFSEWFKKKHGFGCNSSLRDRFKILERKI